ncbi:MAG: hypothetical protein ABI758_04685 [Candidatus Woesebacteria bacterium]
MEKILLVIPSLSSRQLYHEVFLSIPTEVVPTETIANAILLLTAEEFKIVVIDGDDNCLVVEVFLKVRKEKHLWNTIPFLILASEGEQYQEYLHSWDKMISPLDYSPEDVKNQIKFLLSPHTSL